MWVSEQKQGKGGENEVGPDKVQSKATRKRETGIHKQDKMSFIMQSYALVDP